MELRSIHSKSSAGTPPILPMACHHHLLLLNGLLARSEDRKSNGKNRGGMETDSLQTISLD